MGYKVVITGTTGMVGKGVLLECIDHPSIENILIVNRSSVGITHPKVKEVLIEDFFELSSVSDELNGFDACFCTERPRMHKREQGLNRLGHFAKAIA